jgi:VanZ family protein
MPRRQRARRRWLIGYVIALFGTLPLALPCWNGLLRASVGRIITVEAIHVIEYVGLGWLAGRYARDAEPPRPRLMIVALVAGIGLLDEILQGYLPQRVFQWSDVALNWVGGLLGLALMGCDRWVRHQRQEVEGKG